MNNNEGGICDSLCCHITDHSPNNLQLGETCSEKKISLLVSDTFFANPFIFLLYLFLFICYSFFANSFSRFFPRSFSKIFFQDLFPRSQDLTSTTPLTEFLCRRSNSVNRLVSFIQSQLFSKSTLSKVGFV